MLPDDVGSFLVKSMARWVVWPNDEYIQAHLARRDRSAEFPYIYPDGIDAPNPKPLRRGAVSPADACCEAEDWLCAILRPEWRPDDLRDRLVPLQLDPPSSSVVLCRYRANDAHVQIAQNVNAMCLVIRPAPSNVSAASPENSGPPAFRTLFTQGDSMASLPPDRMVLAVDSLRIFLPQREPRWPREARDWWWGWNLWYTDGSAIAIFLPKTDGGAHVLTLDDPWF